VCVVVRFRAVFASSEDAAFPLAELNTHSADSKGWSSAKFCSYPQEVGFALVGSGSRTSADGASADGLAVSELTKIEFLSHQFKIGSKIEVLIGSLTPEQLQTYSRSKQTATANSNLLTEL
jgi:hypothetical protein